MGGHGRYAESQTGDNGTRYRDWVCVYASPDDVEKCRLESHVLDIPEAYEACFKWDGHDVVVRSSLPMDDRLLLQLPSFQTLSPVTTLPVSMRFSRCIRQFMVNDPQLLPVRDAANHYIEHGNVTVYTNSAPGEAEEVLVVYAPSSLKCGARQPQRLEFASFVLLSGGAAGI
jgi:hypothetical protein